MTTEQLFAEPWAFRKAYREAMGTATGTGLETGDIREEGDGASVRVKVATRIFGEIVGRSGSMRGIFESIRKVAPISAERSTIEASPKCSPASAGGRPRTERTSKPAPRCGFMNHRAPPPKFNA